jgi:hypothetical protein
MFVPGCRGLWLSGESQYRSQWWRLEGSGKRRVRDRRDRWLIDSLIASPAISSLMIAGRANRA